MVDNKVVIVSAPSGSGKTTIVKHLLHKVPQLKFSISATSRNRRANEIDKVDYYFLGIEEFNKKIQEDAFIEWEEVYDGSLYGTLKSEVQRIWSGGSYIIFDVDVKGGINLKKYFGEKGLSIFVRVKDTSELEKRLLARGTESEHSMKQRMQKAEAEMKYEKYFDRVLINDVLGEAQHEAECLVRNFLNIQTR